MMKCLYFLLFVAACQAYVARVAEQIPTPTVTEFEVGYQLGFIRFLELEWNLVEHPEILGYRMTVWDQGSGDISNDQSKIFREVVVDASTTRAGVRDLQYDIWYLARVQAFTRTATSGWSDSRWVMFHTPRRDGRQSYTVME
ncbi:uncharacterized protein LOC114365914 [Ostrinia furnacalis]|uniref:uncharacterized protein LOC114365914 n=1 Tax=Ostrinia furnacalis TaxID=93504 RepID=UPI0010401998|nr:uncharacterized protein LOC114365914 [Ostrinia furnacalis]